MIAIKREAIQTYPGSTEHWAGYRAVKVGTLGDTSETALLNSWHPFIAAPFLACGLAEVSASKQKGIRLKCLDKKKLWEYDLIILALCFLFLHFHSPPFYSLMRGQIAAFSPQSPSYLISCKYISNSYFSLQQIFPSSCCPITVNLNPIYHLLIPFMTHFGHLF